MTLREIVVPRSVHATTLEDAPATDLMVFYNYAKAVAWLTA